MAAFVEALCGEVSPASCEGSPPTEGTTATLTLARKRGRPRVATKAPRKARGTTPRVVPCYVDMGTLTRAHLVRYDAGRQLYDLTDLLTAACQGKTATVNKKLSKLKQAGAFPWGGGRSRRALARAQVAGRRRHRQGQVGRRRPQPWPRQEGRARTGAATALLLHGTGKRSSPTIGGMAYWIKENDPDSQAFLQTIGASASPLAIAE